MIYFCRSLYLEEAFEALHFRHRRQLRFVCGSLIAAFVGVTLNVYQAKLKEEGNMQERASIPGTDCKDTKFNFGLVHHSSLALTAILSAAFFDTVLPLWGWIVAILNVLGTYAKQKQIWYISGQLR